MLKQNRLNKINVGIGVNGVILYDDNTLKLDTDVSLIYQHRELNYFLHKLQVFCDYITVLTVH